MNVVNAGRVLGTLLIMGLLAVPATLAQSVVGQPAPDFTGTDINGTAVRSTDYKGKVVVLESYSPACPFSANHYQSGALPALQAAAVNKGVIWLVVNSTQKTNPAYQAPDAARKNWAQNGFKATTMLDDNTGAIGKAYSFKTTPQIVVIDQRGVVAYQGAVDDRPESSGDPKTAHNYVRPAIEALLAGKPVAVKETKPYGTTVKFAN